MRHSVSVKRESVCTRCNLSGRAIYVSCDPLILNQNNARPKPVNCLSESLYLDGVPGKRDA
jgi:hypothetical protein